MFRVYSHAAGRNALEPQYVWFANGMIHQHLQTLEGMLAENEELQKTVTIQQFDHFEAVGVPPECVGAGEEQSGTSAQRHARNARTTVSSVDPASPLGFKRMIDPIWYASAQLSTAISKPYPPSSRCYAQSGIVVLAACLLSALVAFLDCPSERSD